MKDFNNLIQRFTDVEINGRAAQRKYAPLGRIAPTWEEVKSKNPKEAAVNIMLYPKNNEWHFPLILRAINSKDRHSGQISLPGGRKEAFDASFGATAVRETTEEIGVPGKDIQIIREMSSIYISPSNFYVHAFVSWTNQTPNFELQPSEAKDLIEMPLHTIFHLPKEPMMKAMSGTIGQKVPVIHFNGYLIWGATAMILSEFRDLMKNV